MNNHTNTKIGTLLRRASATLLLLLPLYFLSAAQNVRVTGTVKDASGALPGVNIIVEGSKVGTTTDINGRYSISVDKNATLTFSFLSMKTQTH